MNKDITKATCYLEINDKVKIMNRQEGIYSKETYIIEDILFVNSIKDFETSFKALLKDDETEEILGEWPIEKLKRVK